MLRVCVCVCTRAVRVCVCMSLCDVRPSHHSPPKRCAPSPRSQLALLRGRGDTEGPLVTVSPVLYTAKTLCPPTGKWVQMYELVEVLSARLKS